MNREELKNEPVKVLLLSNGDLLIGEVEPFDENNVYVKKPFSVYELGKGPQVMPYMLPLLMEPMEEIRIRTFDIMWAKALIEFPQVKEQYEAATSIFQEAQEEKIIID